MKTQQLIFRSLALTWILAVGGQLEATVLTFDDITTADNAPVPDGYGGFDWEQIRVAKASLHSGTGYGNGVVSPEYIAYNPDASVVTVGGTPFRFNGAYLTAAWNNDLNITVQGFRNSVEQHNRTVVVGPDAPTWFDFNFDGVDELRFTSSGGTNAGLGGSGEHFVMDDFTVNEAGPQPSTGALYGSDRSGRLFTVDVNTGLGTFVGNLPTFSTTDHHLGSTEIEYDNSTGRAWVQVRDGGFAIHEFDIATGAGVGSLIPDGFAFNGLEFVGSTLYGTSVGGGDPPSLKILDPATGVSTQVGVTGVSGTPGLAYDPSTGIMYGIERANTGTPRLLTIDLTTGAATPIGPMGVQAGSIEFGPDGRLYAGGAGTNAGDLFWINTSTGLATFIGSTGFSEVTGLTLLDGTITPPKHLYGISDQSFYTIDTDNGAVTTTTLNFTVPIGEVGLATFDGQTFYTTTTSPTDQTPFPHFSPLISRGIAALPGGLV